MDDIFRTYNFNRPTSKYDLPITHYKDKILNAIKENPFVVLEGPTACGKTTQVPQFILDEAYNERKYCNIVVAQPRRIAASSNAERVANERNWQLGTIIGYQVGFDENKFKSKDTRILYCTTGILLQKLIHNKNFGNYTHIILDEVHERNKEMDFLFVIIKKLFVSIHPRPKIKIIIMSATIQASRVCFKQFMFIICAFCVIFFSFQNILVFFTFSLVFRIFYISKAWHIGISTDNNRKTENEIPNRRILFRSILHGCSKNCMFLIVFSPIYASHKSICSNLF